MKKANKKKDFKWFCRNILLQMKTTRGEEKQMKFKFRRLLETVCIILFFIYIFYQYSSQQQTLNSYAISQKYYQQQISKEQKKNMELLELQDNINSDKYIEQIARDKLDMYLPNERVYIDVSQ